LAQRLTAGSLADLQPGRYRVILGDALAKTLHVRVGDSVVLIAPEGVATTVRLDGVIYPSVTNVGVRPTFGGEPRVVIEAHLIDVARDLYGQTLRLGFIQRLRDERRFEGVEQLTAQIAADVQKARLLFDQMSL